MSDITERQIATIKKLMKIAKIEVKNVESLSKFAASKVIEGLLQKLNEKREKKDYSQDALAGLAVKIMAQKSDVDHIAKHEEEFKQGVVQLYRIFKGARQACLA